VLQGVVIPMPDNSDRFHRSMTYLRISVTDRCNLRCVYCRAVKAFTPLKHTDILSYEECLKAITAATPLGIKKVRLTGGEPLFRRGFTGFVSSVCRIPALEDVAVTTNGVLLKKMAAPLYEAGLRRINVSLDTLLRSRYIEITGRDHFDDVWEGLQAAEAVGFAPIKLNVVVMRGVNVDEVARFAELSFERAYHIRFIECMPFDRTSRWFAERYVPSDRIRALLESRGPLKPVDRSDIDGPAERFRYEGAKGEIGLISPISHLMCSSCNRLRLTADGRLRPCLFSNVEVNIKRAMRKGASREELQALFRAAIQAKPKGHRLGVDGGFESERCMSAIGG